MAPCIFESAVLRPFALQFFASSSFAHALFPHGVKFCTLLSNLDWSYAQLSHWNTPSLIPCSGHQASYNVITCVKLGLDSSLRSAAGVPQGYTVQGIKLDMNGVSSLAWIVPQNSLKHH